MSYIHCDRRQLVYHTIAIFSRRRSISPKNQSGNQRLQVGAVLQFLEHVLEMLVPVNFSLLFEIRHVVDQPSSFSVGLGS
jgi:hypothetical protein